MANLSFLDSIVHCVNILVSKVHYASYLDYKGEFCKNKHVSYFKHYTRGQGNVNFKNSECCPNHHFCHLMWGFILHLVLKNIVAKYGKTVLQISCFLTHVNNIISSSILTETTFSRFSVYNLSTHNIGNSSFLSIVSKYQTYSHWPLYHL